MKKNFICLSALLLFFITGCDKDKHDPKPADYTDTQKVNKFVVDCTEELYLWESSINWSKYANEDTYRSYADPYSLLEDLRHKDDRWSMLTEDVAGLYSILDGVTTTYGFTLAVGKFSNKDAYYATIAYVSPHSPAELAGLKRGDFIVGINGGDITDANYSDLFESSSISLTMGELGENGLTAKPVPVNLTAVNMYEDPINTTTIIRMDEHIIGYVCYTGFIDTSEPDLEAVFRDFQNQGVTDVVLDLRYNGGGYARTAQILCSILAPQEAVNNQEVYLTRKWNDLYNNYWQQHGGNEELFVDTLSVNMNLDKLYVLVTVNTASASEATIIGLSAYMDVTLIGTPTHGKYYGGYVFSINDYYESSSGYQADYYQSVANWGMSIITYRYANKNNYPDFSGGLTPKVVVEENFSDLKPFGDISDPLLGRAVEQITGKPLMETRSDKLPKIPPYMLKMNLIRPTDGIMIHRESPPRLLERPVGNMQDGLLHR